MSLARCSVPVSVSSPCCQSSIEAVILHLIFFFARNSSPAFQRLLCTCMDFSWPGRANETRCTLGPPWNNRKWHSIRVSFAGWSRPMHDELLSCVAISSPRATQPTGSRGPNRPLLSGFSRYCLDYLRLCVSLFKSHSLNYYLERHLYKKSFFISFALQPFSYILCAL